MIRVDRSAVPPPTILLTRGAQELERAAEFYAIPEKERRQRRFSFTVYRHPDVRAALEQLFHGKCAYCESRSAGGPLDFEHFRPKGGVVRPNGKLLPDHYWWLVNEWDNLYLACAGCNRMSRSTSSSGREVVGKGDRFPLENEATRAALRATPDRLRRERPLLLDPCRDDPEAHLVFLEDGTVVSDTPRGQATIEILGLNRPALVQAREDAARAAKMVFQLVKIVRPFTRGRVFLPRSTKDAMQASLQNVVNLTRATEEYAGLKRQLVGQFLESSGIELPLPMLEEKPVAVSESKRRRAKASHRRFLVEQESFSLADEAGQELYRSVRRRIERIVVRNVKGIQIVDLDLTASTSPSAPWLVLLGENGTGKSTILQAAALALIGQDYAHQLALDPADFIRRAPNVTSGSVEVYLTGSRRARKVIFRKDGFEFIHSEEPQTLVLGFGGTRLLPESGAPPASRSPWARVESLFRPTTSLIDADAWLRRARADRFGYTAGAIRNLLDLPRDREWLEKVDGKVGVREHGRLTPLKALSTGYQSVLATVIDIVELTFSLWPTPESAEGVVLLDEIDTHLHPTWKMQIVRGLRQMMPAMQFITTTHEPLCLRGLEEGEIVLMKRDAKDRAFAVTDLPSPRDLRVDQLLTSKHFGLNSTLDPDIDKQFDEYYQLLGYANTELTQTQRDRRADLARDLQGHGVLGYTRRDQLVYEAIDEFLAEEQLVEGTGRVPKSDADRLEKRREETRRRVADLWRFALEAERLDR